MRLHDRTAPSAVPTTAPTGISPLGRMLALAGAAALAVGTLLPWVEVEGIPLDLDWLGVGVPPTGREVAGTDTAVWPALLAVAGVVALLALIGRVRRVVIGLGLLTVAAAGALVYYLSNVIEIETSGRSQLEQTLADVAVRSAVQPGPYLLLAGGALIVAGGLMRR